MTKKLLFVVHRYYPDQGGSENNTKNMADECVKRGYDVTVLTNRRNVIIDGVKLTNDSNILNEKFDLIIVHGSCPIQDIVLVNSHLIKSPILYLLIQPSEHPIAMHGLHNCTYLGWGTSFDLAHIKKHHMEHKAFRYTYGLSNDSLGVNGFRQKYGITTKQMFISTGGFWLHKNMNELKNVFIDANIPDTTLVLTGYDNRDNGMPTETENVKVILGASKQDVMNGLYESDLYILNSQAEGFGLGIIESMINNTPWLSTDVAAAHDCSSYGLIFHSPEELKHQLQTFKRDEEKTRRAYEYVSRFHRIENCIDGIEELL